MILNWLRGAVNRRRHGDDGRWGEEAASEYLEAKGFDVLCRNFRVRGGEADLVARKDGLLVVVEVKARRSRSFGTAAEAVGAEKSRRVLLAGRVYCRRHGISLAKLRGDVVTVEVEPGSKAVTIRHLPGGISEREGSR